MRFGLRCFYAYTLRTFTKRTWRSHNLRTFMKRLLQSTLLPSNGPPQERLPQGHWGIADQRCRGWMEVPHKVKNIKSECMTNDSERDHTGVRSVEACMCSLRQTSTGVTEDPHVDRIFAHLSKRKSRRTWVVLVVDTRSRVCPSLPGPSSLFWPPTIQGRQAAITQPPRPWHTIRTTTALRIGCHYYALHYV